MTSSINITDNDVQLIATAFQRKYEHLQLLYKERPSGHGITFPVLSEIDILGNGNELSTSFISQSQHCLPIDLEEYIKTHYYMVPSVSPYHDCESRILNRDLKICEKTTKDTFDKLSYAELAIYGRVFDLDDNHSFQSLKKWLCFQNYSHFMPLPMQKNLERIKPKQRLSWIVNLLIEFHFGHECQDFMTIAVKLTLRALQLSMHTILERNAEKDFFGKKLQEYLNLIQRNHCNEHILPNVLKTFYVRTEIKWSIFRYTLDLQFVLENIKKTDPNFRSLINHTVIGNLRNFDACLFVNPKNFITLVQFGAFSKYSKEDWDMMKWRGHSKLKLEVTTRHLEEFYRRALNQSDSDMQQLLRAKQVSFLFSQRNGEGGFDAEYVLKLLWMAIPDPFLTEEEFGFLGLFRNESPPTWLWYSEIILGGENQVKSPRSLQHTARCAIRERLALNLQLPEGIQHLKLNEKMTDYLSLKDCGTRQIQPDYEHVYLLKRLFSRDCE